MGAPKGFSRGKAGPAIRGRKLCPGGFQVSGKRGWRPFGLSAGQGETSIGEWGLPKTMIFKIANPPELENKQFCRSRPAWFRRNPGDFPRCRREAVMNFSCSIYVNHAARVSNGRRRAPSKYFELDDLPGSCDVIACCKIEGKC